MTRRRPDFEPKSPVDGKVPDSGELWVEVQGPVRPEIGGPRGAPTHNLWKVRQPCGGEDFVAVSVCGHGRGVVVVRVGGSVFVSCWVSCAARSQGRSRKAHDGDMDVQLLYFEGCPHRTVAEGRLRSALVRVGREEEIQHVLVATPEDAQRLGFIGSPTILVDGLDPFATGGEPPSLACRVFSTPEGRAGSPTEEQLAEVLA